MFKAEDFTAERCKSLIKSANVSADDLKMIVMEGPMIVETEQGPLMIVDNEVAKQVAKIWPEVIGI